MRWMYLLVFMCGEAFSQPFVWQSLPSPYGGNVEAMILSDSQSIIAGGETGLGLFRSTNGADSWVDVGCCVGSGRSFFSKTSDGHIWASEEESSDDGLTWYYGGSGISTSPTCLAEYPNGDYYLGAATWRRGTQHILYRSTDRGATWRDILDADRISGQDRISSIAIMPNGYIVLAGGAKGLWLSPDTGTYFYDVINNPLLKYHVLTLSLQKETGTLYAGTDSGGVFRSYDNGLSWDSLNTGLGNYRVNSILFNPRDTSELFLGTSDGIYYTHDNGKMWQRRSTGIIFHRVNAIVRNNAGMLFAGTIGGVYRSSDNGLNWVASSSGINRLGAVAFGENPQTESLFLLSAVGAFYRSKDRGQSWTPITPELGKDWVGGSFLADGRGNIFVGTGSVLFHSTDNGDTWKRRGGNNPFQRVILDTASGIFYGGSFSEGVFQSIDTGRSWQQLLGRKSIYGLSVLSDGEVFAQAGDSLFISNDHGVSWVAFKITFLPSDKDVGLRAAISPVEFPDGGTVFQDNVRGVIFLQNYSYLARSTDQGKSWQRLFPGDPNRRFHTMAINKKGDVFIGSDHVFDSINDDHVFRSTDDGLTWDTLTDVSTPGVYQLFLDQESYLYAITNGGLYRSVQSTITGIRENSDNIPTSFSLSQNYPNPFNPTTEIRFQIPVSGQVSLRVFNLLGEEVATLVNEQKTPGSYTITWDAGKYPSGMYFYRIVAGSFRETKKLVLVR